MGQGDAVVNQLKEKGAARFEMTARSVSIWDVAAHVSSPPTWLGMASDPVPEGADCLRPNGPCEQVWAVQRGEFAVAVGASSADTRLRGSFNM